MPTLSELAALGADGSLAARGDTVLVTDASAEGETIGAALRERGYHVVDVPLALFEARVTFERPRVLVVDVDEPGAVERAAALREQASAADILVIGVGDPARGAEVTGAPGHTFERPVELHRLVELVGTHAVPRVSSSRGTTPPPSYAPRPTSPPLRESERPPTSDPPPAGDEEWAELALAEDALGPLPIGAPVPLSPELEAILLAAEQKVAEQHARTSNAPSSDEMADDDGKHLPAELLAALDEPLDAAEAAGEGTGAAEPTGTPTGWPRSSAGTSERSSETHGGREPSRSGAEHELGTGAGTGAGASQDLEESSVSFGAESRRWSGAAAPASTGFGGPTTTAFGPASSGSTFAPPPSGHDLAAAREDDLRPASLASPAEARPPTVAPGLPAAVRALPHLEQLPAPSLSYEGDRGASAGPATASSPFGGWATTPGSMSAPGPTSAPGLAGAPVSASGPAAPSSAGSASAGPRTAREPTAALPEVFTADDAARVVALAISSRLSGALALRTDAGTRHIILHEGDLVTAASTSPDESLASFLVERGDIGRDVLGRMGARLPASGRLAGAALVANGYLAQDDLWSVLRSHAEWIVARAIASGPGTCSLDPEPPGRLKSEPGVFGGAAGAEVFVEIVRRTIPPAVAVQRLGGGQARIDLGPRSSLLAECALSREEEALVRALPGRTVSEALQRDGEDLASVLLALADLEVLGVLAAPRRGSEAPSRADDPLDDEAIRVRVRARLALVAEGDYFSVLGVARDATAYEIKRAYLDLRRTFEPSRLLTARTADLVEDLRTVLEVADEAYEILRDTTRRERYRRAIENGPPG